jgi:hypothetical protein
LAKCIISDKPKKKIIAKNTGKIGIGLREQYNLFLLP